jgi:diaminopimelate epimerase
MSGTGNDFIVFDNRDGRFSGDEADFFAAVCRRRVSVGADGVLLVERGRSVPVRMRYFNRDGGEASMCANGARCAARYAFEKGFVSTAHFTLEASDGCHEVEVEPDNVRLRMGEPKGLRTGLGIVRDPGLREGGFLDTGVPHLVLFVDGPEELDRLDVEALSPYYRRHPEFPQGTNVNFVCLRGKDSIGVRTFERGVEAETLSCGTGCVAAALLASLRFELASPVSVATKGGVLFVIFDPNWKDVRLSGTADRVFEGTLVPAARRAQPG